MFTFRFLAYGYVGSICGVFYWDISEYVSFESSYSFQRVWGWRGSGRDAKRKKQPCRPASGYVLHGRGPVAQLRRLRYGEPDLPLLRRQAALSVRLRPQLHDIWLQQSDIASGCNQPRRSAERVRYGDQRRESRGRRSGAALPEIP